MHGSLHECNWITQEHNNRYSLHITEEVLAQNQHWEKQKNTFTAFQL